MTTESTPVTVHQHTGGSSTFANFPYDVTLSSDQAADEVLGVAVLSDGSEVVVTATVGLVARSGYVYPNVAGYQSVQVTSIDNGVATTNTLSFASGADFLDRAYNSEDLQVVALSGGGYVIAETTVDDNIGPVNQNLYFEVFNNAGQVVTSWTQVNQSGSNASENDAFQLKATSSGGFVIEWGTNDEQNGFYQRFNAIGGTTDSPINFANAPTTLAPNSVLTSGFAVDTAGNVAISIPHSGDIYTAWTLAVYSSSDALLLQESWATAESGLITELTVTDKDIAGDPTEHPVNTESTLQDIQPLPSGGFLAVVSAAAGSYDSTTAEYAGYDMYLQRITVSGSTVTFDTPVLVEQITTPTQGGDLGLDPVVLSNGNIAINVAGTWELLAGSELPSTNSGMASSTVASLTPLFGPLSPSGTTIVDPVSDDKGGLVAALQNATNGGYYYGKLDSSVYVADFMPCYCPGTLIQTKRGQKKVEKLKIGDKVMTASGEARPIKWIGRRSYSGRFVMGRKDILPICIKAGALEDNVPKRDLWISPNHAMYLDGVLIEAKDLVNGVSIVQAESAESVEYYHVELDSHDVLIAEGALAESYIDDDNRLLFHNAHEYREKYPDQVIGPAQYYAPRCDSGYELETVRQRIALRAGLLTGGEAAAVGNLRGYVDRITGECVAGWAQNLDHPEAPVCLDVLAGGLLLGQVLANGYREDLEQAGVGSGCHSFEFMLPPELVVALDEIEVRRSLDGVALELTIEAWRMLRQSTGRLRAA
ncbi:MAG: Hint domain-containing protein [Xanthobacteraceae bacterium]